MNWYKFARLMNNLDAMARPKRLPIRIKNILLGKLLARIGFWRFIWK